ncbi:WD40-repeat-containing domain protein [Phakopsora pachyrhizi]|uniref:WD40-repeat-containing domain protein n=1 Tax=Phakopsora pachyrhizi TaxID=170000 RepID=A0AAV0BV21_PHAPC|nr:WD40-repeat-containing domain protein [Phakopsora pachyrhizi]CAH7690647.1 WD40-repeat-containing domain protein [Phakopsora pachyrhizi]
MTSLISSAIWVRRGIAERYPKRYILDEKELERVALNSGNRLEQVKEDLLRAQLEEEDSVDVDDMIAGEEMDMDQPDDSGASMNQKVDRVADDLAEYNLENYDKEKSKSSSMGAFSNIKGLQYYQEPDADPYVTLNDLAEDEADERQELEIYSTDSLLITAKTEDDVSQLEVYIYDESEENLYIHHDLLLPAMPLCLEWIDFTPANTSCANPTRKGNFVAVGTMDPDIEVWNLDLIDSLYPDAILGSSASNNSKYNSNAQQDITKSCSKKKKEKKKSLNSKTIEVVETHHTSSILSLSHNKSVRNLLLSSSADTTIKLWDLMATPNSASNFTAIRSFNIHQDKVQSAQWNPKETSVVLSGGWDRLVKVWDSRCCSDGVEVLVNADVECLRWNLFQPHNFLVSLDNGLVQSYDSRFLPKFNSRSKKEKALWTLSAHESSVSAIDISPTIPGLLLTGGVDKIVKVWNIDEKDSNPSISMVVSRDLDVGKVFSVGFCPDSATIVAVAGSNAKLQVWDLATNSGVRATFGDRLKRYADFDPEKHKNIGNDGVLGLANDDETDEEDD